METQIVRAAIAALLLSTGCNGVRVEVMQPLSRSKFDARACAEAALRRNPDPADMPMALAHFRKTCSEGDAAGCSMLGVMHERGLGVDRDEGRAAGLYEQGCAAGDEAGCVSLGRLYAVGRGVPRRLDKAMVFFAATCRADHAPGCTEVARMYAAGRGVPQNARHAATFFERACDKGDENACYELGRLHETDTIARDTVAMIVLYEKACTGGVMDACEGVGRVQGPPPADVGMAHIEAEADERAAR